MKRSAFLATLVVGLVIALGVVFLFQDALATNHTLKYNRVKISAVPYLRFQGLMVADTDTLILPFTVDRLTDNPCDTTIAILNVYSARAHSTDSVSVDCKYEYSSDGVTWSTPASLGTDSTSWATANVTPTYKLTTVRIGSTYGAGWQPYYRVKFLPRTGCDSALIKVDLR